METKEAKVTVYHQTTGEKREFTKTQWNLIGTDPKTNGGFATEKPAEADEEKQDDSELGIARRRFEELTGEKPGRKQLATLQEAIKEAEDKAAEKVPEA